MRKFLLASALAALIVAPAISQDVRNTYVGVTAQIADGIITSAKLAASLSLTTPNINVATATSVNKVTITAPATSATLTITDGQTLSYAEGSWSPTLVGSAVAGTGQTYVIQVGSYEKIGRNVTARFYVQASSLGTAAGNINLGGLPFTVTSTTNDVGTCAVAYYAVSALAVLSYGISGYIPVNGTVANFVQNQNTTSSVITIAQAGSSATFTGVCNYRTN